MNFINGHDYIVSLPAGNSKLKNEQMNILKLISQKSNQVILILEISSRFSAPSPRACCTKSTRNRACML